MIDKDDFIEWKEVHGNMYGTAKSFIKSIQEKGQIPLLDIDVQGTVEFVKAFPETHTLFVFPESYDVLKKRLESRGTETPETLAKRLGNAGKEITIGVKKDDPLIGYRMFNKDIEEAKGYFLRLFEALY